MTKQQWLQEVRQRASLGQIHPTDPYAEAARVLLDWHHLAAAAPDDLVQRFAVVKDRDLNAGADTVVMQLMRGDYSPHLSGAEDEQIFNHIAFFIRGLDEFLCQTPADYGATHFGSDRWLHDTGTNRGFVIPRAYSRRRKVAKPGRVDDIGPFSHRALQRTRVLPEAVGTYKVKLHPVESRLKEIEDAAFGAALFDKLRLKLEPEEPTDTFRVAEVECANHSKMASEHIARAHKEGCGILGFPELAVTPAIRTELLSALKRRPWLDKDANLQWTIKLMIAGSWHEQEGDQFVNLATLTDGWGKIVLKHRKMFPYVTHSGAIEGIRSGDEIPVLVFEDALVAFGICRDFCERGGLHNANPYTALDVDLCSVVSYGAEKTMENHLKTVDDVRVRFRTGAFIVQQGDESPGVGYVLSPYTPDGTKAPDLVTATSWNRAPKA